MSLQDLTLHDREDVESNINGLHAGEGDDDDDVLTLPSDTLALLASFLESKRHPNDDDDGEAHEGEDEEEDGGKYVVPDVRTFRNMFGEDWGLSQFWYSDETANNLSQNLLPLLTPETNIAFLCCPTGFVSLLDTLLNSDRPKDTTDVGSAPQTPDGPDPSSETTTVLPKSIYLFEYDARFKRLCPPPPPSSTDTRSGTASGRVTTSKPEIEFVKYDLDEPDRIPDSLKGNIDIIVIDPPFINETSQRKLSHTISLLFPTGPRRQSSKLILLTSTALAPLIPTVYPFPTMKRAKFEVEHDGGRLRTPYGLWINSFDGREEGAGFEVDEEVEGA